MSQIEYLREKLYKVINAGETDSILKVSRELDELILLYMEDQLQIGKKSA